MAHEGSIVVIGGSSGLGLEVARHYAERDHDVVLTSRDAGRAEDVAAKLGGRARGIALDLAEPERIAAQLDGVGGVEHLVVAGIERDENSVSDYDVERATRLVTMKLVGYTEVVHALLGELRPEGSVVMFGGLAKERPYPGSTTITTVNGGVNNLVKTLAVELAPIRVNAIHPAIVGDSPYWRDKPAEVLEAFRSRTPLGRLVTMADVVDATVFLLENRSVTGINLNVDGGWLLK